MATFQIGNFLIGIIVMNLAGPEAMGVLQFFIVTSTFFAYFGRMGGDENLSYTLPSLGGILKKDAQIFVLKIFKVSVISSVLSALGMAFFIVIIDWMASKENHWPSVLLSFIYLPVFVGTILMASVLRAEQMNGFRSLIVYIVPMVSNLLLLLVFLVCLDITSGTVVIIARAISYIATLLIGFYLCKVVFKGFSFYRFSLINEGSVQKTIPLKNCWWLLITLLVFVIESGALGIWLGKIFLSEEDIGYLSIMIRLSALLLVVPTALTIVMGPIFARYPQDRSGRKVKMITLIANIISVVFIFLLLAIYSDFWLGLFSNKLLVFQGDFLWMLLAAGILAATQPLYSIALAHKNEKAIVNIGLIAIGVFTISAVMQDVSEMRSIINSLVCSSFVVGLLRLKLIKLI